ncbi:MAG TPA: glycoside hydrolase family 3 N-terminal domain-containing protein [Polyangiaceae bacterium]|nr:glycoside hydrolase family 3 N-terminal domain-containing protein [Polyangiaceae bacterium]
MPSESQSYLDPELPAAKRTELLLAQMTLEEKVGQMCQYVGEVSAARASNVDEVAGYSLLLGEKVDLIHSGRVGSFLKVPGALEANYLQQQAEATRLKIPLLIGTDAIHGHGMDLGASTIFPSPISLAASFDVGLAQRVAEVTAREMRVTGFHWSFSPNVDIVRDPRWGRTGETFGEDPYLAGELGAAMVVGYQGSDFSGPTHVLACTKHLVGGGVPDNVLNGSAAELSERTLREFFLPPFERTVKAGVYTLMPAHNEVNGVPCHADDQLLTRELRGDWGFQGFVISDWLDIERLHSVHHIAETRRDADRLAVLAGVDMHMHGGQFFENVVAQVREGQIPMSRIDDAARKILFAKFQLGLFEKRYADETEIQKTVLAPAHVELALEGARKSLVLLKNDRNLLPLEGVRSLLVTGPDADDQSLLGDWARVQPEGNVSTILGGLRALAPSGVRVEHAPTGPIASISDEQIAAAVAAARNVDVVVLAIGENSLRDNPVRTSGENVDRASLEPPGRQLELMRALVAVGKPVVVVLVNGAPIASEWMVEHASALLEAWEPGMRGGTAIAEVLFGRYNPSGKLPMTVPRSTGHIKIFYNYRPSAYHRGKFRFDASEPLFEFGHGLSFTTFAYRDLRLPEQLTIGEPLVVDVEVENTGARAGEEVVLLYLQDVYASVTRPVKELKGFQRVALEPGQKKVLRFELPPDAFTLLDRNMKRTTEPGEFKISVGPRALERSVWLKSPAR